MKIYEKAIENYAKARKKFYRRMLRHDVEHFDHLIDKMVADCECRGIECKYCPVHLAADTGIKVKDCGLLTLQEVREILAMEIKE